MKKVLVLIERDVEGPAVSGREAVRMAVGLTLGDNEVTVAFAGRAARAVSGAEHPEVRRYVDGLERVQATLLVERNALEQWGDAERLRRNVQVVNTADLERRIRASDVLIPFRESHGLQEKQSEA